jgi:hypothetical protein
MLYATNPGPRWAYLEPGEQFVQIPYRTLRHYLHRAIDEVSCVAGETDSPGSDNGGVTKAHTLNPSRDPSVQAATILMNHLERSLLSALHFSRIMASS